MNKALDEKIHSTPSRSKEKCVNQAPPASKQVKHISNPVYKDKGLIYLLYVPISRSKIYETNVNSPNFNLFDNVLFVKSY